jgi:hypothetical protein
MKPPAAPAIFLAFALLWPLFGPHAAWSQQGRFQSQEIYTGRNAYVPAGQRLTSAMVRDEIERCLPDNVIDNADNDAILWNVGYDFFRNFPRNQDTAQAIKDGFLSARGGTPEQRRTMLKAAIYWEKIHDYGITNVPAGEDLNTRDKTYYGDHSKFTTLPRRPTGSKHAGYPNYDWPGRFINKREPYRGRPDNPHPGKYYPGVYPP